MSTTEEVWRPVAGLPRYEVSDRGHVRNVKTGRILRPGTDRGYLKVSLFHKSVPVHRLVALAFCAKNDGLTVVNHLNGVTTDNRAENLEWTTNRGNSRHSVLLRGRFGGLTAEQCEEVAYLRALPYPRRKYNKELAAMYGVSIAAICRVAVRAKWNQPAA